MLKPGEAATFAADADCAGMRVDKFLTAQLDGVSRSMIQRVIAAGEVTVNGAPVVASRALRSGDTVVWVEPAPPVCETATAEDLPIDVLHEDEVLMILNKPAGMVVHPGAGNQSGTLVSALLHYGAGLSSLGGLNRPGIVHRLDRDTSGCLVVAKSDRAHRALAKQFADRVCEKTYLALVAGAPRPPEGTVNEPIGRHPSHRQRMAIVPRGREAITLYRTLWTRDGVSLVECRPRTGRTHQIRVHLKHLRCPVLGDVLYGQRGTFDRHMLHAWKLRLRHPVTRRIMDFEAPLPEAFVT
jgi:23S rRNA pseudouridine1911/1915/1917 synthase